MTLVRTPFWVGQRKGQLPTVEETQGNLHFLGQSSDSLQWLTGFNRVRSQVPGGEMHIWVEAVL